MSAAFVDSNFEKPLQPDEMAALCMAYIGAAQAVAVAVSGGPDSMALCRLLSLAGHDRTCALHILTVDHGLRAESSAEAQQVGRWVADWPGVQHHILTRTLPDDGGGARLMEAARTDRYAMMAEYCRARGITKLLTAHHQDDQAETLLFRLAKGSGLDGLAAMAPVQDYSPDLQIIRPLLDIPKTRLIATCRAYDVPYVSDPSNDERRFARPRLRQARAVLEEEGLSAKRLAVTAARLRRARQALDYYAKQVYEQALLPRETDRIVFSFYALVDAPEDTRLRVLVKAMQALLPGGAAEYGYGPRREKLEALCTRIFGDEDFKSATLHGFLFRRAGKGDMLEITPER